MAVYVLKNQNQVLGMTTPCHCLYIKGHVPAYCPTAGRLCGEWCAQFEYTGTTVTLWCGGNPRIITDVQIEE
jgi:hypothetical protein